VTGYNFKASFERLANIFRESLKNMNLNDQQELKNLVISIFLSNNVELVNENNKSMNTIDKIVEIFRMKTKNTVSESVLPPETDKGIEMMNNAIERVRVQRGGRKRKIRFSTRKSKIKRRRIKSQSRKN
jgi:hypothetical protein